MTKTLEKEMIGMRREPRTDAEASVLEHVEWLAEHERSQGRPWDHDRLARQGQFWTPQPLPRTYPLGRMKQCFQNAGYLILDHPELRYVEGYATSGLIPVHHAWAVDKEGRVIDPTWRTRGHGKYATRIEDLGYYGIPFTATEFRARMCGSPYWGMLFRWWDDGTMTVRTDTRQQEESE